MAQLKNTSVSGILTITGAATLPSAIINNNGYFQSKHFRGEGGLSEYYHAMEPGYAGHNAWDWYEYGGVYNFWKNTVGTSTGGTKIFSINNGNIEMSGNTITSAQKNFVFPSTAGTIALTEQLPIFSATMSIDYAS